jgi:hypothetical protein
MAPAPAPDDFLLWPRCLCLHQQAQSRRVARPGEFAPSPNLLTSLQTPASIRAAAGPLSCNLYSMPSRVCFTRTERGHVAPGRSAELARVIGHARAPPQTARHRPGPGRAPLTPAPPLPRMAF